MVIVKFFKWKPYFLVTTFYNLNIKITLFLNLFLSLEILTAKNYTFATLLGYGNIFTHVQL